LKRPKYAIGFKNIILLHSNHRHASTTHVAIFRVVRTRIQLQLQCVKIIPHLKSYSFWLQFTAACKIAMITKYMKLKINPTAFVGLFNKTVWLEQIQQAKHTHAYTNAKGKLLKTNIANWFDKMCRSNHLIRRYINITVNGSNYQSIDTKKWPQSTGSIKNWNVYTWKNRNIMNS
jgi:hypothetical protein